MPGTPSGSHLAYFSSLQHELLAFKQFHSLLLTEQDALVTGDTDRLLALAQQKNQKVIELTQLADSRNTYLSQHAGSAQENRMEAWLTSLAPTEQAGVAKIWGELIELARNAKIQNQLNGQLIQTRLANNQQALKVLLSANVTSSNLYGKDGQAYATPPTGSGRPLGKA